MMNQRMHGRTDLVTTSHLELLIAAKNTAQLQLNISVLSLAKMHIFFINSLCHNQKLERSQIIVPLIWFYWKIVESVDCSQGK